MMTHTRTVRRRSTVLSGLVPFAVAAIVGVGQLGGTAAQESDQTVIEPGVLTTPVAKIDCGVDTPGVAGTPVGSDSAVEQLFSIVSEESAARYKAEEELQGIGATTAVGETQAFIGQFAFDANGMPLACSRFDVDLRTLKSDEARRDNFLYNNTLESETYPLATFVLTEVGGLDAPIAEGEETTFTLIGNLTLHGVTKLVAWEATVTRDGDKIEGKATTTFNMPDFNIEPPKVGPVVGLDEKVTLEVDIVAEAAE